MRGILLFSALFAFVLPLPLEGAKAPRQTLEGPGPNTWADFVEPNFPFFSSVLDARDLGKEWPADNLTPRGLILQLGHNCWACFDTELLRMAVIWEGKGVTPAGMARGSYKKPGHKAPEGQEQLPEIIGTPWIANGIYPGWQGGRTMMLTDPREPGPDKNEVGRGPMPEKLGRYKATRLNGTGAYLEYEVAGIPIREYVTASDSNVSGKQIERHFHLEKAQEPLWLLLGKRAANSALHIGVSSNQKKPELIEDRGLLTLKIEPTASPLDFGVLFNMQTTDEHVVPKLPGQPAKARWPEHIITQGQLSASKEAFVLDDIPLPLSNAQKRNVRLADIAFFKNGEAAAVTFDGDVWKISGLSGDLQQVHWRRFASGLHEPLSLCIRDDEIFVFDRNGIWRLRDLNGNGEADEYELFSNNFTQTSETREFANGMKLAPDGAFLIAKGGQQSSTLGKHNGSVLRVSADGKQSTVLGSGLRQPFIGVNPLTGLITASDQQGHYVPATPIHIIENNQYYGFLSSLLPREKYPAQIADPLTWIPHSVNASGASQVWLANARMGPLNDALVQIGYNRPELFLVRLNTRAQVPQAAVMSLMGTLPFAPLNGAVNPADGQLYVGGFQIWGSTAKRVSGLARLRHTGIPTTLPREIATMENGVLLRFDLELEPISATNPANFSAERWNYKRTANYGSPHFKLDGTAGQEWMTPSSAYISRDSKSVFIGMPDMKPVMQMRIGWALETRSGSRFEQNAYLTPRQLTKFDPGKEGFESIKVDLTPRVSKPAATPITVEEGQKIASLMGCTACHASDNNMAGKVGPPWKGLFASERKFKDAEPAIADEAYLRESILDPSAKIVLGFEKNDTGMPSYAGVLTDSQIEALILYIKTLK
jgi:cytochrome c2